MSQNITRIHDIALATVLNPTIHYRYRIICREFSSSFNIPLTEVEKLPIEYVLRHHFEAKFEGMEEEDLLEIVARAIDPNFDENEESSIKEFIKLIDDEQSGLKPKPKKRKKVDVTKAIMEAKQKLEESSKNEKVEPSAEKETTLTGQDALDALEDILKEE